MVFTTADETCLTRVERLSESFCYTKNDSESHFTLKYPTTMSTAEATAFKMPRPVSQKIARVRRLLRLYVLTDGLAALLLVLGCAFWVGLAIDWLLEPSPWIRKIMWAIVIAASLFVAMQLVLRRVFARLPRASIALILERQFPDLRESLDRKSTRLNSSHTDISRMPSSA